MSIKNKISIGRLTAEQAQALRPYVNGRVVHDLGAGLLGMAPILLSLGAVKVVAVDEIYKDRFLNQLNNGTKWTSEQNLQIEPYSFEEYLEKDPDVQVALVSWPNNEKPLRKLVALLKRASKVVYLGCNTGGTSCGTVELFNEFRARRVHEEMNDRHNSLAVYGSYLKQSRSKHNLTAEEFAKGHKQIVSYDEAIAKRLRRRAVSA